MQVWRRLFYIHLASVLLRGSCNRFFQQLQALLFQNTKKGATIIRNCDAVVARPSITSTYQALPSTAALNPPHCNRSSFHPHYWCTDSMFPGSDVYGGTRASYLALCATALLGLSLLSSLWASDGSGTLGLLALVGVYIGSQELLMLFIVLAPFSVLLDFSRMAGVPHGGHGRGWFVFLTLLEMAAKAAGTLLAWSLHRSAAATDGYTSAGGGMAPSGSNRLPSWAAPPAQGGGRSAAASSGYARLEDPFAAAYAPPPAPPGGQSSGQPGAQPQSPGKAAGVTPTPTTAAAATAASQPGPAVATPPAQIL